MPTYPWIHHLAPSAIGLAIDLDSDLFRGALMAYALEHGRTIRQRYWSGRGRTWMQEVPKGMNAFRDILASFGGHAVIDNSEKDFDEVWVWADGFLQVSGGADDKPITVSYLTMNPDNDRILTEWQEEHVRFEEFQENPGNDIHAIMRGFNGYVIRKLAWVDAPLVEENYTPEVVESFKFVCKELNRDDPFGRITILDGPPGTGKTWLIRALIHHNPECQFVVVPPDMVGEMGKPELLPVLLANKDDEPMILVLEDADQMLSDRMAVSMTSITSALNIGDGLLGEALNIRLICSTNQPLDRIDEAMRRPGRLSRRIEIGKLTRDQAVSLYHSKGGVGDPGWEQDVALADVYAAVKLSQENA